MSNLQIHLPTKEEQESPQQYVNKKLVPIAAELYRLVQLNTVSDRTSEKEESDMTCHEIGKHYKPINTMLETDKPKSVKFSLPPNAPPEKNGKLLKVLFSCTCYSKEGKTVAFRLSRKSDNEPIEGSQIQTDSQYPHEYTLYLPIGHAKDTIWAKEAEYVITGKYVTTYSRPVVRRFSLSLIYV